MIAPIDYTIDVQTPFMSALQGYQTGATVRDDQFQQQQRQNALLRQQRMQQDIGALFEKPTPSARDYAALTIAYPELKEQLKQGWEMTSADQQKGNLDFATRAYAALSSGRPEIAEKLLRDRAAAMRSAGVGDEEVKSQELWADMIKEAPDQARHIGGLLLSSVMDPDKFEKTFSTLGDQGRAVEKAPAELARAQAEAETARVKSKYANSDALLDLEKKGWDIKKVVAGIDIDRQNSRIAAMNAAIGRETNDLKRQELALKVAEAKQTLDAKVREKVATAESGAASIDNMLNTIERVKKNPALDAVLGPIEGNDLYAHTLQGMLPGTASAGDRNDAISLIETLGSQAFVAQIPAIKGTGALSDAEGKKLQSALQNLSRKQSERQFRENLDEAARLLNKSRENLARSTGVPLGKPDTPAAPGARPPLSSFQQ